MLVRVLFLSKLESALSHLINLDPKANEYLNDLAGKVIGIHLQIVDWTFFLCPNESGIQILESYTGTPDTQLSGTPLAFAAMGLSNKPMNSLFSGEIKIEGDVTTGRGIQSIFEKLDINWEQQLARFSGDTLSHEISNLLRSTKNWGEESVDSLQLNVAEFLKEESQDLPSRFETNRLLSDIDTLRSDTDRLNARCQRLLELFETPLDD